MCALRLLPCSVVESVAVEVPCKLSCFEGWMLFLVVVVWGEGGEGGGYFLPSWSSAPRPQPQRLPHHHQLPPGTLRMVISHRRQAACAFASHDQTSLHDRDGKLLLPDDVFDSVLKVRLCDVVSLYTVDYPISQTPPLSPFLPPPPLSVQLAEFYMGARLCSDSVSLPLLLNLPALFACTPDHLSRILPSCIQIR